MKTSMSIVLKILATSTLLMQANATWAHEGHGMSGSHWHATDVAGFVVVGVALALAVWFSRGDK